MTLPPPDLRVHRIHPLQLLKFGGGGLVMLVLVAVCVSSGRDGTLGAELLAPVAFVLFAQFAMRWNERVELSSTGIQCHRLVSPFAVSWAEIATVGARQDALGPYEIHLALYDGKTHKLKRRYANWDELVKGVLDRVAAEPEAKAAASAFAPLPERRTYTEKDATSVGRFVSTLPGGTHILDLRSATNEELTSLAVFDLLEAELKTAGPSSEVLIWVIPATAIEIWSKQLIPLIDRLGPLSVASTTTKEIVTNAFVVVGPCPPAPALSFALQSLGMTLHKINEGDDLPFLEAELSTKKIVRGLTSPTLAEL